MARVQYGSQITALSGSIGGITFHKNAANNIARLRPSVPRTPSSKQFLKQSIFNYLVNKYADLNLLWKQQWNDFAAAHTKTNFWGEEKTLSGYNWFLTLNYWKYTITQSTFTTPPTYQSPTAVCEFETVPGDNVIQLIPDPEWPSGCYKIAFSTCVLKSSSLANRKDLRWLSNGPGTSGTWDITSDWEAAFNMSYPVPVDSDILYILAAVITVNSPSFVPSKAFLAVGECSV